MGNLNSRSDYMKVESFVYAGLFGVSFLIVAIIISFVMCGCCCKEENSTEDKNKKKSVKDKKCNLKWLFLPYRVIFNFTLAKIFEGTGGEYLFGGYKQQDKKQDKTKHYLLHVYYLSMLLVAFNWFIIVTIDHAFYRKVFTCNDPNTKDSSFLCFSLEEEGYESGPINCSLDKYINVPVICYIKSLNLVTALSIGFSFARFITFLIQASFMLTLWCAKKGKCCESKCCYVSIILLSLHIFATVAYLIGFILCIFYSKFDDDFKVDVDNPFYGDRVMRYFMAGWGFVTLLLITILSPYRWLVEENTQQYLPEYKQLPAKENTTTNQPAGKNTTTNQPAGKNTTTNQP